MDIKNLFDKNFRAELMDNPKKILNITDDIEVKVVENMKDVFYIPLQNKSDNLELIHGGNPYAYAHNVSSFGCVETCFSTYACVDIGVGK